MGNFRIKVNVTGKVFESDWAIICEVEQEKIKFFFKSSKIRLHWKKLLIEESVDRLVNLSFKSIQLSACCIVVM